MSERSIYGMKSPPRPYPDHPFTEPGENNNNNNNNNNNTNNNNNNNNNNT